MSTCDTCKWWKDDDVAQFSWTTNEKKKICESQKMIGKDVNPDEDGFTVQQSYFALYTGPKFGCIHHEPL